MPSAINLIFGSKTKINFGTSVNERKIPAIENTDSLAASCVITLRLAMSKEQTKDLSKFLEPFGDDTIDLVMWLRDFAWDLCPQANELIYDNYNAVAFGWSPTDKVGHTICSIAVWRSGKNVHFGFYWGNELSDPEKRLLGKGNQYRYILVTDRKGFPKAYMKKLVNQAHANSLSKVKDQKQIIQGQTIVKSISQKKRPGKAKRAAAKPK